MMLTGSRDQVFSPTGLWHHLLALLALSAAIQFLPEAWRAGIIAVYLQARQLPASPRVAAIPDSIPQVRVWPNGSAAA